MLTIYRRHSRNCPHFNKPRHARGTRACALRCTIWVQGSLNGEPIRRSLELTCWEAATDLIRAWERDEREEPNEATTDVGGAPTTTPSSAPGGANAPLLPTSVQPNGPLVETCITAFLQDCKARNLAASGIDKYESFLRLHLLGFCGERLDPVTGQRAPIELLSALDLRHSASVGRLGHSPRSHTRSTSNGYAHSSGSSS